MAKDIQVQRDNMNPVERMPDLDRWIDNFFGDRFGALFNEFPMTVRRPVSQIRETDNAYVLTAEVPGIPMSEIEINVSGNVLTIHAEKKSEVDQENQYQRDFRSFHQSFSMPTTVDQEKIEAHCENGVLEVLLPKVEMAKPKKVQIQTGKGGFMNRLFGTGSEKQVSSDQSKSQRH